MVWKYDSGKWNRDFSNQLLCLVFILLPTTIVFSSNVSTDDCISLLVYVNGCLVMVPTEELISQVKVYLDDIFTIKDLGISLASKLWDLLIAPPLRCPSISWILLLIVGFSRHFPPLLLCRRA